MSIALLAPLGLALLAALPIPILLHLARRTRAPVTPFAAMRWLAPGAPPRSRVQLEELLLLALRLLLIALLALWLAQPVWRGAPAFRGAQVVVMPGVDYAAALDAIPAGAEAHWLSPGFPRFDGKPPAFDAATSSLLREFDADLAADATLTVLATDVVDGLDDERIRLVHAVDWKIVRAGPAPAKPSAQAPVLLAVRYGPAAEATVKYLRAAVSTWQGDAIDAQPWGAPLPPATTWLVGLDGKPDAAIVQWLERGGTALLDADPRVAAAAPASDAPLRVRRRAIGAGTLVLPNVPLRAGNAALLDPAFPNRLRRWLAGAPAAPARARAEAIAPTTGASASTSPALPLAPWLALAIAALFALERTLANGPRLGVPR